MSLTISKRTRNFIVKTIVDNGVAENELVDITTVTTYGDGTAQSTVLEEDVEGTVGVYESYSEWTTWAVTTDNPPYDNTDILEYKITSDYDNNVDFDEKYYEVYGKIMAEAIKDGTPYKESIDYISSEFENFNLTDIQKADLTVKYIASITNPVTIQAMQVAMSLADKDLKAPNEIAMQEVQKDIAIATKPDKVAISEWQEKTAEENYNYAREKAIALPQSIIFNNYSKTLDYFKEAYGQHKIGGGTITQSMWTPPLEVAKALMTSNTKYDFNYTAPTTSE